MAIKLSKELLTTEPENLAKEICKNGKDTSTQIRRFYDDFLILKTKADLLTNEDDFRNNILPLICFSKAKIAYAIGRDNISKSFCDNINKKVDAIETRADFENFLNYYQALIGYVTYYAKLKKEEEQESRKQNQGGGNQDRQSGKKDKKY